MLKVQLEAQCAYLEERNRTLSTQLVKAEGDAVKYRAVAEALTAACERLNQAGAAALGIWLRSAQTS